MFIGYITLLSEFFLIFLVYLFETNRHSAAPCWWAHAGVVLWKPALSKALRVSRSILAKLRV